MADTPGYTVRAFHIDVAYLVMKNREQAKHPAWIQINSKRHLQNKNA